MIRLPIRATRSTNSVHKFARSSVRCYTLRTTESEMVVVVVIIGFLYEFLNSFLYEPPPPSPPTEATEPLDLGLDLRPR